MTRSVLIVLALSLACGSDEQPAQPSPAPEEQPSVPETLPEEPEAPAAPALTGEPMDLLQAVPTTVRVSSVNRGRVQRVARLFDGDRQTAWNSESDDLVGAWIEVTLPADAQVEHVELTSGHIREGGASDLFQGNHRVKKVRVLRDGEEVGTYDLDTDSRSLQSVPASGPGGTWRIEVAEVVAGSRPTWKEVCVSELRFVGRAPGAAEDTRFPRWAVGEADPEPAPEPPSNLRLATHQLVDKWLAMEKEYLWSGTPTDEDAPGMIRFDEGDANDLWRELGRLLGRALALAGSSPEADRIRREMGLARDEHWSQGDEAALAVVDAALTARMTSEADEAKCRWAQGHARIRLQRVAIIAARMMDVLSDTEGLDEEVELFEQAVEGLSRDGQTTTRRMLRNPLVSEIPERRALLENVQRLCGWE